MFPALLFQISALASHGVNLNPGLNPVALALLPRRSRSRCMRAAARSKKMPQAQQVNLASPHLHRRRAKRPHARQRMPSLPSLASKTPKYDPEGRNPPGKTWIGAADAWAARGAPQRFWRHSLDRAG